MLSSARVHPALPASDLERARGFYEGTLGLTPERVFPGGVFYAMGEGTRFFLYPSGGRASGAHTQMGFRVADIEAEVTDLKARGVTFEEYDMPNFDTATSVATFEFNRSAWFKDTEGNLLGLVQFLTEMP